MAKAELFELAAIGMALTSLDGRFLVVNPRLCALLGHTAGDLASSGLFDITHPDDWSNVAKALADLNRDAAESFTQRQRCLAADGAQIWVDLNVTPTPGRTGLPMQFLAQFTDVTAEVENLQTLHASARHFQVLSENSTDVVAQTDPQGLITWVSPSVTTLLGWETGLLAGRAITAFVAKPDLERFSAALASIRHWRGDPRRGRALPLDHRRLSVHVRHGAGPHRRRWPRDRDGLRPSRRHRGAARQA